MDASKENARKANDNLEHAASVVDRLKEFALDDNDKDAVESLVHEIKRSLVLVQQFIESSQKRLPSQAAIDRDKGRKRKTAKAGK